MMYGSALVMGLGALGIYLMYFGYSREMKHIEEKLIGHSKMASLGNMAAGIAHELNQPLGTVLFNSETTIRLLQQERYDKAEELCKKNVEQIKRATTIMNSLRIFSREGASEDREDCDVKAIIDNVLEIIKPQLIQSNITWNVELSEDLPKLVVSRVTIEQVLSNLLINARDSLGQSSDKKYGFGRLLMNGVC